MKEDTDPAGLLLALDREATPGEWTTKPASAGHAHIIGGGRLIALECPEPDARLITEARNALPTLLARLHDAEHRLMRVRAAAGRGDVEAVAEIVGVEVGG